MKKVALILCMTFVGSMALSTAAMANTSANKGKGTVTVCQEKPCPKDCKCDKCTKAKEAKEAQTTTEANKDAKACCKKESAEGQKCTKSGTAATTDEKKCTKATDANAENTQTKTNEPEKK